MKDALLVLNAGSSSLKFSLFANSDPPELLLRGQWEGLQTSPRFIARDSAGAVKVEQIKEGRLDHCDAVSLLFDWLGQSEAGAYRLTAAGHRIVHGGRTFAGPVKVNDDVLRELDSLVPLAPLHQPHNVAAIRAVAGHSNELPQVACFDTSFHRTLPLVARTFAVPRRLTDAGVQRYGFHGLSYEYIASRLPEIDARAAGGKTIVAHLGNGSSLCALQAGVSVATTMGLTPLDGVPMGTRCGEIDPGVLLYLLDHERMDARALEHLLYHESGLLGVSNRSSDMRALQECQATDSNAAEAIDLFVYHVQRQLGSLAAALSGLDALVFTGGIGENSAYIRSRICEAASWLGIQIDVSANEDRRSRISHASSRITVWVIPTNEELMIAQQTRRVLRI